MIKIVDLKDTLKNDLKIFIWDFKVGDNIKYNLDILYNLIDDYNNLGKDYKKPISIIAVSIIEAIMVDFMYRLYSGTNHFPNILGHEENNIKEQLKGETIKSKFIGTDGKEHYYSTLKNFNFSPMVEIYKKFKLIGSNKNVYKALTNLSYFRNRIHINNYFNNFEKNENVTFSEERTQKTIIIMIWIINYFKNNYARPWPRS